LKDQIAQDLDVFLNPDEFGEEHTIDGQLIVCAVDSSGREQFAAAGDGGIWTAATALYAKTSDLAGLAQGMPKPNNVLTIDGRKYMVISVGDEMGMTRVVMEMAGS